jgi:hypothetical protein
MSGDLAHRFNNQWARFANSSHPLLPALYNEANAIFICCPEIVECYLSSLKILRKGDQILVHYHEQSKNLGIAIKLWLPHLSCGLKITEVACRIINISGTETGAMCASITFCAFCVVYWLHIVCSLRAELLCTASVVCCMSIFYFFLFNTVPTVCLVRCNFYLQLGCCCISFLGAVCRVPCTTDMHAVAPLSLCGHV